MANIFLFANRHVRQYFLVALCAMLAILVLLFSSTNVHAVPRTPSQALPEMFQKPPGLDFYNYKKNKAELPIVPEIQQILDVDNDLIIKPTSLIILTPKPLQKILDLKKYNDLAVGKDITIDDLYNLAFQIEQEFSRKGFPLVRVILPTQELEPGAATVFFKVIDGFIEKVDISNAPKMQTLRTFSYLRPLIGKNSLKLEELEKQLLLASNSSGISISTTLAPGEKEGGTILIVEGDHKLVSGGITFDNSQNKELGREQGQIRASFHSPMGLGETITAFGLAKPTPDGIWGTGSEVPIRAGGLAASIPIGNKGLAIGATYTESMTRPGEEVKDLGLEANMKSASINVSYPLKYKRDLVVLARSSINWIDEIQHTNASGLDEEISHDRITSLKVGVGMNRCTEFCLSLDAEISKGISLGSRTRKDVGPGTPLSREAADVNFSHLRFSAAYKANFFKDYLMSINTGGQYSFSGSVLNSEQMGIAGDEKLSGLASGGVSGDEAWYVRAQVNRNISLANNLSISPYLYSAAGKAYLSDPTASERSSSYARAVGIGLEFGGEDSYFIDKSVTGKFEFSKNWASSNLEKTYDTRFSNNQMFLKLAVNF